MKSHYSIINYQNSRKDSVLKLHLSVIAALCGKDDQLYHSQVVQSQHTHHTHTLALTNCCFSAGPSNNEFTVDTFSHIQHLMG